MQNNTPIIYLIPIKFACYKVFIVLAHDCTEIMEDISPQFVQFSNLPTIMKPSLVPQVPRDQCFCNHENKKNIVFSWDLK